VLDDKIVYISKLFDEEMHVVVRADSGITMIDQLAGRKVNFSDVGSGAVDRVSRRTARFGIGPTLAAHGA
jgi:TRAP-type uncharacterized transport system substrate-binding protein